MRVKTEKSRSLSTQIPILLAKAKKIFFASDLHLGVPDHASSLMREKHFVKWLDHIKDEAAEIFLLGDILDFWFEYTHAVPKGYVRLFGKLAELADAGIPIHWFVGNHDLWLREYIPQELGIPVYHEAITRNFWGKNFYIVHGDGLGPGDGTFKLVKKYVFTNRFLEWCFRHILHPDIGIGIANHFSRNSRKRNYHSGQQDYGEKENLLIHSREMAALKPEIDYFVFGHRHFPKVQEFEENKFYINLGDWIQHFTYLEVGQESVEIKRFPIEKPVVSTTP